MTFVRAGDLGLPEDSENVDGLRPRPRRSHEWTPSGRRAEAETKPANYFLAHL